MSTYKTERGRRLAEIRQRIVDSGISLQDLAEINADDHDHALLPLSLIAEARDMLIAAAGPERFTDSRYCVLHMTAAKLGAYLKETK